jgi:hypothetical protein
MNVAELLSLTLRLFYDAPSVKHSKLANGWAIFFRLDFLSQASPILISRLNGDTIV